MPGVAGKETSTDMITTTVLITATAPTSRHNYGEGRDSMVLLPARAAVSHQGQPAGLEGSRFQAFHAQVSHSLSPLNKEPSGQINKSLPLQHTVGFSVVCAHLGAGGGRPRKGGSGLHVSYVLPAFFLPLRTSRT